MRRLHRLVDDPDQVAGQRRQLNLVPRPRAEGCQRLSRVVGAPVEAVFRRTTNFNVKPKPAATAVANPAKDGNGARTS